MGSPSPPTPSTYDKSDQKATLICMDLLAKLPKSKTQDEPKPSTSKKTQVTPSRKRFKPDKDQPKITPWLTKETSNPKRANKKKKLKPLDVSVSHKEKEKQKNNSTYKKYGVVVPTFEKILADQKRYEEHKNSVKKFDAFDYKILEECIATVSSNNLEEFSGELLDCRHLTSEELDAQFFKYCKTLEAIMKGTKYSERHDNFHNRNIGMMSVKDLRCSTSMVVFTQEQKEHLLDMMIKAFDSEDKLATYFFKVLLPELCLRIFMDVHKMSKKEASEYLDKRPLDI